MFSQFLIFEYICVHVNNGNEMSTNISCLSYSQLPQFMIYMYENNGNEIRLMQVT